MRRLPLLLSAAAVLVAAALLPRGPTARTAAEGVPMPEAAGPGTLVVDLVDGFDDLEGLSNTLGVPVTWASDVSADEALAVAEVPDLPAALELLAGDPRVEAAEQAIAFQMLGAPNDPLWSKQWNLQRIDAPAGWDAGGGDGVVVAVIDTGVAPVEDLAGVHLLPGRSFVDGVDSSMDDQGHGTHVAGTIAQATNNRLGAAGVAPKATLLPIKVLSREGFGRSDWIAAAIDYAADEGADVINLSLGGPDSAVVHVAVTKAVARGVVVVAAAGNSGTPNVASPANHPRAIGVSAVAPGDTLAPYSSWGQGVDLSAPGGDTRRGPEAGIVQNTIEGPWGGIYPAFQGTSMAAPHVAGAAAVLRGTGLSAEATIDALQRGSVDLGAPGLDPRFGHGRLDVDGALKAGPGTRNGWLGLLSIVLAVLLARISGLKLRHAAMLIALTVLASAGLSLPRLPGFGGVLHGAAAVGPDAVGFPVWASALPPLLFAAIAGLHPRGVAPAVALATSWALALAWAAGSGGVDVWGLGGVAETAWLGVNAALSFAVALGVLGAQSVSARRR